MVLTNEGRKARGGGYGSGIRVGDVVIVPSFSGFFKPWKIEAKFEGKDIFLYHYRVTQIKYDGKRRDWYQAAYEFDDTLFDVTDVGRGEITRRETGTTKDEEPLTDDEKLTLDLVNASAGLGADPGSEYYPHLQALAKRGLIRCEGRRYYKLEQ